MIRELEIFDRVLMESKYVLETKSTIRETAKTFRISKSTAHKDLTERLLECDKIMYDKVQEVLQSNKSVRHIRGGQATKIKHLKK